MANPNIVNVATINGKTDTFALTTASANLVTATANTVFKINSILIANIDGTNAADIEPPKPCPVNKNFISSIESPFLLA